MQHSRATYDDARLIMTLYESRREPRLRDARKWFSANFKPKTAADLATLCPPGSEENASYRMVLTYWEMVASFITGGVLNKELFFQSGREMLLVWERVRDVLPGIREQQKDALYYGNLEVVAHDFIEYLGAPHARCVPGVLDPRPRLRRVSRSLRPAVAPGPSPSAASCPQLCCSPAGTRPDPPPRRDARLTPPARASSRPRRRSG